MLPVIVLGIIGAAALLVTRKDGAATPSVDQRVPRFTGRLRKGALYRVWTRADPTYVQDFRKTFPGRDQQVQLTDVLKSKLEKAGFYPILFAVQDPSASDVWTFIGRWALASSEAFDVAPLHLYQLQEVDNVPEAMRPPIDPPLKLDDGLLVDEIEAIKYALVTDDDPKHLTGFSFCLSPEFPIASSLLNAKAILSEQASRGSVVFGAMRAKHEDQRRRYESACVIVGAFDAWEWVKDQGETAIDRLKELTEDLGATVQDMWDKYGGIVEVMGGWVPGPQIWMVETAYKMAKDINEGKPIAGVIPEKLSEQGSRFARGMQATSPFVAMIPGLGTGIAMAMNASAALALAQPLDQAMLDTIAMAAASAVPGGGIAAAIAQRGFSTAARLGGGMMRGESWDELAANEARASLKAELSRYGLGEAGGIAFDAGLALARGKSLQGAGFQALYQLTGGNELADRAAHFAEALVIAKQQGRSVKSVLIDQMGQALDQYGRQEAMKRVNETIALVQKPGNGWLLQMTPSELGQKLGIAEEIARTVQASLKEIADGVRVVDAEIIKRLSPATAVSTLETSVNRMAYAIPMVQATSVNRLTYASPSALKMVEATRRPEGSLVIDPAAAAKRLAEVEAAAKAGDAEAQRAKESLDKATRELERRKWVEWYKRQRQLSQDGVLSG